MDASRFMEWLQHASRRSGRTGGRRILRFRNPVDYRRCLQLLRRQPPPPGIRQLGIIRALSCPLPDGGLPPAFSASLDCEDDPPVRVHAAPARARLPAVLEQGVPWGVRRIRAPEVWSKTTGYRVKVGVIDTGVDFTHPDLRHSLERGINLIQRTMLPYDDNGHGTHISGTIAAANRLQGMIGVAPRASIYPVKAFDHNGTAFVSDIILGIDWCVRNRLDIVNMSFGMTTRSKSLLGAVSGAYRAGVLIVASSGNDGKRGEIDYPAGFGLTVAVGAIDRQGRIASFTNRDPTVDIYAPGEAIVSAWPRGKRREMSGTSMATSHVTGAVALLLAYKPGLSPGQIKSILRRSAKPLKYGKSPRAAGELDVTRMLRSADRME